MTTEEQKALIRRHIEEAFGKGNFDVHHETSHPHRASHSSLHGDSRGLEEARQRHDDYRKAFSDQHIKIDRMVVEGDMAAIHVTLHAKHTGDYMGIPPTGKEIKVTSMQMFRFEGDKIAEVWTEWDMLGALRQMGVIPAMAKGG